MASQPQRGYSIRIYVVNADCYGFDYWYTTILTLLILYSDGDSIIAVTCHLRAPQVHRHRHEMIFVVLISNSNGILDKKSSKSKFLSLLWALICRAKYSLPFQFQAFTASTINMGSR
jgi:hypothetical protein